MIGKLGPCNIGWVVARVSVVRIGANAQNSDTGWVATTALFPFIYGEGLALLID